MKPLGRVLLVTNNFPPIRGGSAVVYENLARYAHGAVSVIAPRLNYTDGLPTIGWREHDRRAPYRIIRRHLLRTMIERPIAHGRLWFLAADLWIRLQLALTLLWLILRGKIVAICIGELLASGWVVDLFRHVPGLRLLVYVHGEEITTDDPYDPGHRRRRRALLAADRIVVVSRFTLQAVRDLLGAEVHDKISLIENGVDTARFQPFDKRADLLALYRLEGCFVFVSVCRLLEKKGIDQAIRAFAGLAAAQPPCRYLIVGTGPYEAALRAIAEACGVAAQVVFAGQVTDDDLVAHYCLGDVFVMPNRQLANGDTEGFGLVFLEANACGLPVIAGRDGGSTDAVRHGVNGLVVDGAEVAQIAEAMAALHDDAALRARLREGGRVVAAEADWRGKAEAFLRLCDGARA